MGGKPENVGSLGDIEKVAKVFVRNELIPLQDRIREINGWLGQEVIRFKNYSLTLTTAEHRQPAGGFFTPRHHALTRSPPHKTARIHTNAPANNLNAITTRSDAEK